jgi:hypothetical protein
MIDLDPGRGPQLELDRISLSRAEATEPALMRIQAATSNRIGFFITRFLNRPAKNKSVARFERK